jgi:hypothetical protein
MKEFTFRLPVLVGIILSIIVSFVFPARAAGAATIKSLSFDLPAFLGMPLEQALLFLVSSAVLGALVLLALKQFGVDDATAAQISAIVVAVVTAALTAGLKFVPPEVLGMSVWQALVAVVGYLSSLAGMRAVKTI